jgi:hypothetical protein
MNPQKDHKDFLICASAGYTCLGLSLFFFVTEGVLVKADWIPERTLIAFVCIYTAILFLFPASLAYARMVSAQKQADSDTPAEPVNSRKLITRTVLFTLAIALMVEVFAVGSEAILRVSGPAVSKRKSDLYANQDSKYVGVAAIDPKWAQHVQTLLERNGIPNIVEGSVAYGVSVPPDKKERAVELLQADVARHGYWARF